MKRFFGAFSAALIAANLAIPTFASAKTKTVFETVGYRGDVDGSMTVDVGDVQICRDYLISGDSKAITTDFFDTGSDGLLDIFDLVKTRRIANNFDSADPIVNAQEVEDKFIEPIITPVTHSMPSKGEAREVFFYVDFPDCHFTYEPSLDLIRKILFGQCDETDPMYPLESINAFYQRASKGELSISGEVFRYTASHEKSYYESDRRIIIKECLDAFDDVIDFTQFDSDKNGEIDAVFVSLPKAADASNFSGATQDFNRPQFTYDGLTVGKEVLGNSEILGQNNYTKFFRTIMHETGHTLGIPDYYLFNSDSQDGFRGNAGSDIMDREVYCDFDCFSKLMLGWYRESEVQFFDGSQDEQMFTLGNAQSDDSNCVIIPYGDFNGDYFSEYLIMEYTSIGGNNKYLYDKLRKTYPIDAGVRIFHVYAPLNDKTQWVNFKYKNNSEYRKNRDDGYRLMRLVGEGDGGNVLKTGDIVSYGKTSGFGWYDENQQETVDPKVEIEVGKLENDQYTVTVRKK